MEIRHTAEADLARVMDIYARARAFMAAHGNPHQWGPTNWPPEALIRSDIERGKGYICVHEGRVVGAFFFDMGRDIEPTYRHIEDITSHGKFLEFIEELFHFCYIPFLLIFYMLYHHGYFYKP